MKAPQVVLHVEDDPSLQFLFRRLFEKEGFAYHCVPGVEQAMAYVEHQKPFADQKRYPRPDVVVTDLSLPRGRTAAELIAWLRKRPEYERTPIVVLTGGADWFVEEQVMRAGANAFIVKGMGMHETMEQLQAAFRNAGVK